MQNFDMEIIKHILIFIYMIPFFLGASLITFMTAFASKGKTLFNELYMGMLRFYIPFFIFLFVNYIMSYIDYLNTEYTPYILLLVLHDISFVLFVCFWINSNNIPEFKKFRFLMYSLSSIYVIIWFLYYLARNTSFLSVPWGRFILLIYDTAFFGIMISCFIYCLLFYIKKQKTHSNRIYFVIINLILIVYLLYMYITNMYINIHRILDISVSVYKVYFFDFILPVSIAVSLVAFITFFKALSAAEIYEHENYLAQIKKSRTVSPAEFAKKYNLSSREKEVLAAVLLGKNNKQIADELYISIYTVKRHMSHIFEKTGTASRYELMSVFNSLKE